MLALSHVWNTTLAEQSPSNSGGETVFDYLSLRDQEGRVRALSEFKNKTVLVNFIFTSCSAVCPLQTQQIAAVQKQIPPAHRDAMRFLSVSVDPLHDSPKKLKSYAKARGVNFANWSFMTGDAQAIAQFTHLLGAFDPRVNNPSPADHATQLYLFDKRGNLMQRYNGVAVDKARIAREMQELDQLRAAELSSKKAAS